MVDVSKAARVESAVVECVSNVEDQAVFRDGVDDHCLRSTISCASLSKMMVMVLMMLKVISLTSASSLDHECDDIGSNLSSYVHYRIY